MNTIGSTNPVRVTPKNVRRPVGHDKRVDRSARYSDNKHLRKKKSDNPDRGSIDEYA